MDNTPITGAVLIAADDGGHLLQPLGRCSAAAWSHWSRATDCVRSNSPIATRRVMASSSAASAATCSWPFACMRQTCQTLRLLGDRDRLQDTTKA